MLIPVKSFSPKLVPGEVLNISEDTVSCKQLKDEIVAITGIPSEQFKLYQSKRYLHDEHIIQHGQTVHMLLELRGGKGGFGSMLRAIGAQIEKTTNKEACRDLSGRRLRDINEEKRLKKWIAKQAERERERAERKQRRLERLRALPPHEFHDPAYDKICLNLSENVSDAVSKGLENMKKNEGPLKRKATSTITKAPKKLQLWNDEEFNTSDTDDPSSSENSKDSTEDDVSQNFQVGECSGSDNSTSSTKTLLCAESHSSENEILIQDESLSTKKSSEKEDLVHNMNAYNTVEELEALGLAKLKIVLSSLNMKCGGTLRERATRLFAVKETKNEEIDQILKSMK